MKIDMWLSHGNDNLEGEISFFLISGAHEQLFKRSWTVINTPGSNLKDMQKECLRCLTEIRLKELMQYLYRQLEENVIVTHNATYPLEYNWRIE